MDNYLSEIFYNIRNPNSFSSKDKLYIQAQKDGKNYTRNAIEKWLEGEEVYTLFKPVRNAIKRSRVIVPYTNYEYESDCMYMKKWEKLNKGYGFVMVIIDLFTRFLWAYPLKTLTAQESSKVLGEFFTTHHCEVFKTDNGGEFLNFKVKTILKDRKIKHILSRNTPKANFAERVIKTLKFKLVKNMYFEQSHMWIDYLDDAVYSYNNSRHRTIKMTPAQARVSDPSVVWGNQYLPTPKKVPKREVRDNSISTPSPNQLRTLPPLHPTPDSQGISNPSRNSGNHENSPKPHDSRSNSDLPTPIVHQSSINEDKPPEVVEANPISLTSSYKTHQPLIHENPDLTPSKFNTQNIFEKTLPPKISEPSEPRRRSRNRMIGGGTIGGGKLHSRNFKFRYNIGDTVRIARLYHAFKRAYDENWTHELFTIVGRSIQQGLGKYTVKSWANELIDGDFYDPELQRVNVDTDTVYKIDRVIKNQKRGKTPGKIVSWLGWPSNYNSWVSNKDFRDIKDRKA